MIPVSVVVVTKDEQINIGDALESVKDFDDIVVVDSFSKDETVGICRRYTDRVFQHAWLGYAKQKQMAVDLAEKQWVLILDADERITPELKAEIAEKVKAASFKGFYIARKNYFLGKWIRHSGWWPDYTLRLFRKEAGRIETRYVHEKVTIDGDAGYLKNPLIHYTYRTITEYIRKADIYSTLAAMELEKDGKGANFFSLIFRPLLTFSKMFFIRKGFRDGVRGLILAVLYSYYTFLKYVKVWEKSQNI